MLTQAELQSILNYDPETGIFTRIKSRMSNKVNKVVGTLNKQNRVQISINAKIYKAHRLAWLYVYGEWPQIIDHINGNPADNRICNLRECTTQQNNYNAKLSKRNTSGIKGVRFDKDRNKWEANLRINGKRTRIGRFNTLEDAKNAIENARRIHHGNFANHG